MPPPAFYPEGGLTVLREQIERLSGQPPQRLGIGLLSGLAISLWSANGGMKAIFDALNVIYGEKEKREFIKLNAISLAFTLGTLVFMLAALASITLLPIVLERSSLSARVELLVKIGRWPILLVTVSFAIALIYRFGPSRDTPQWRWISPWMRIRCCRLGGSLSAFRLVCREFWQLQQDLRLPRAVIGFLTWLWLTTVVILLGAKLNAEIEHQTVRDTTEGQAEPLGRRGARMADTVGEASTAEANRR